ncbi:acyltransferase [Massilia sp. MB5]|uniref:acyltransferase family protein n=1 Tax=Massilia sp. MB5 TaxID=2919578 RepID=UPI0021A64E9D|nr:acyltransferase family protein [Massilia sp. MB5]
MIKAFEGGRGVAALIVALFHFRLVYQVSVIQNGYLFVDLFFVLSGFLICSLYWRRLESSGEIFPFLIRRFGRLFPLLIFSTILFILARNGMSFIKNQLVWHGYAHFPSGISGLGYDVPKADELLATVTMTHGLACSIS